MDGIHYVNQPLSLSKKDGSAYSNEHPADSPKKNRKTKHWRLAEQLLLNRWKQIERSERSIQTPNKLLFVEQAETTTQEARNSKLASSISPCWTSYRAVDPNPGLFPRPHGSPVRPSGGSADVIRLRSIAARPPRCGMPLQVLRLELAETTAWTPWVAVKDATASCL